MTLLNVMFLLSALLCTAAVPAGTTDKFVKQEDCPSQYPFGTPCDPASNSNCTNHFATCFNVTFNGCVVAHDILNVALCYPTETGKVQTATVFAYGSNVAVNHIIATGTSVFSFQLAANLSVEWTFHHPTLHIPDGPCATVTPQLFPRGGKPAKVIVGNFTVNIPTRSTAGTILGTTNDLGMKILYSVTPKWVSNIAVDFKRLVRHTLLQELNWEPNLIGAPSAGNLEVQACWGTSCATCTLDVTFDTTTVALSGQALLNALGSNPTINEVITALQSCAHDTSCLSFLSIATNVVNLLGDLTGAFYYDIANAMYDLVSIADADVIEDHIEDIVDKLTNHILDLVAHAQLPDAAIAESTRILANGIYDSFALLLGALLDVDTKKLEVQDSDFTQASLNILINGYALVMQAELHAAASNWEDVHEFTHEHLGCKVTTCAIRNPANKGSHCGGILNLDMVGLAPINNFCFGMVSIGSACNPLRELDDLSIRKNIAGEAVYMFAWNCVNPAPVEVTLTGSIDVMLNTRTAANNYRCIQRNDNGNFIQLVQPSTGFCRATAVGGLHVITLQTPTPVVVTHHDDDDDADDDDDDLSGSAIAAIIVCSIIGALLCCVICIVLICICRKRNKKPQKQIPSPYYTESYEVHEHNLPPMAPVPVVGSPMLEGYAAPPTTPFAPPTFYPYPAPQGYPVPAPVPPPPVRVQEFPPAVPHTPY